MRRLSALFLLLLPILCFAQGAHRLGQVLVKGNNVAANVGPYANIQVCVLNTACKQFAPIFSDPSLTVQMGQPVIADGNGNYNYYIASGCVDEQISTPGQGQIFVPNVCPFNGQAAGKGLPPGTGIVKVTSSEGGLAGFADVTSLFNVSGGCNGFLKSDGTCGVSASGVVGTTNAVGSFSNSTTTKPTNGTVDTAGNLFTFPAATLSNSTNAPFTLNQTCSNPSQAVPQTNTRYACGLWNMTNNSTPNVGQHPAGFVMYQQTMNLTDRVIIPELMDL